MCKLVEALGGEEIPKLASLYAMYPLLDTIEVSGLYYAAIKEKNRKGGEELKKQVQKEMEEKADQESDKE